MDVFKAIKNRRSVRTFTDEPVSDAELEKLIDAARWAPSAGNTQPWEFIIIRDPKTKSDISKAAGDQTSIEEAPATIIVCANTTRSRRAYSTRGTSLYCIQDTAAATQNMLLAAQALGLGTCWIGAFDEEQAREALNMPENVRPLAIIPIGHAADRPKARSRRPLAEITHHGTYKPTKENPLK